MSKTSGSLIFGLVSMGIAGWSLYKRHKAQLKAPIEGDIFIGQYSIIHQIRELTRAKLKTPPATIYVINHFIQRTHPDIINKIKWGQKPHETSISMEHSSSIKKISKEEYLTFQDVVNVRLEAIKELREMGYIVEEIDEIKSVRNRTNGNIYVEYIKNGITIEVEHIGTAMVFNSVTQPRTHYTPAYQSFSNTEILYQRDPKLKDCDKIVFGPGPAAIWVKECCPTVNVKFASRDAVSRLKERFKDHPRNKSIVDSINSQNQILIGGEIFGANGDEVNKLKEENEFHQKLKNELKKFLNDYNHLNLKPGNVIIVYNIKSKELLHIGEGINAIGYEPNEFITIGLFKNLQLLHTNIDKELIDTVAPQTIKGSVLNYLDYQRFLLFERFKNTSIETQEARAMLIPFERLFFRKNSNSDSYNIKLYLEKRTGLSIPEDFFKKLEEKINLLEAVPKTPEDIIKEIVTVFEKIIPPPKLDEIKRFEEQLKMMMKEKQRIARVEAGCKFSSM